jgi:hypothetical protein
MSDHILKRDPIQQLQQQIETWQALLEKLGVNERSHPFIVRGAITSSSYSSRLRRGKRCWKSWEGMNKRSEPTHHFNAEK